MTLNHMRVSIQSQNYDIFNLPNNKLDCFFSKRSSALSPKCGGSYKKRNYFSIQKTLLLLLRVLTSFEHTFPIQYIWQWMPLVHFCVCCNIFLCLYCFAFCGYSKLISIHKGITHMFSTFLAYGLNRLMLTGYKGFLDGILVSRLKICQRRNQSVKQDWMVLY